MFCVFTAMISTPSVRFNVDKVSFMVDTVVELWWLKVSDTTPAVTRTKFTLFPDQGLCGAATHIISCELAASRLQQLFWAQLSYSIMYFLTAADYYCL